LTTGAHDQQGGNKVAKGFALMAMCLRHKGLDIVFQASGLRVLCHSKPNSRTSPFSFPLAHLANVSRPQCHDPYPIRGRTALKTAISTRCRLALFSLPITSATSIGFIAGGKLFRPGICLLNLTQEFSPYQTLFGLIQQRSPFSPLSRRILSR